MTSALSFSLTNRAVSKRTDDFDYTNKNIRRITIKAILGGREVGSLTGYLLDIESAYRMDSYDFSEVEDLMRIEGEINSLCSFMYGVMPSQLSSSFRQRQRVFSPWFRKIVKQLGYQKPNRLDLLCGDNDFKTKILYVSRLCVDPKIRGAGIGSALMQQLSNLENKVDYIALMSYPYQSEYETPNSERYATEQAQLDRFYHRLGFIQAKGSRWMLHAPEKMHIE